MKKVLILGIDTFAAKNMPQVKSMSRLGYVFTIATTDSRNNSVRTFNQINDTGHKITVLSPRLFTRLGQVRSLLRNGPYNHIELYAGGRFTLFYICLLRYYRCNWIVVERGDIGSRDSYSRLIRHMIEIAYRAADAVWYKEPYMRPLLKEAGAKHLYFVPNAAEVPALATPEKKDIDFLWANRLVYIRYPEWIVRAIKDPALSQCKTVMLGLQPEAHCSPATRAMQDYMRDNKSPALELQEFVDPRPWYCRSRFFLLPARLVFGNNALLEAMAHGVVPIVTESPGIEMLITDGVNGFISKADETSFQQTMIKAYRLDQPAWQDMSQAAIGVIEEKFGLDLWSARMEKMYKELAAKPKPGKREGLASAG
ncbi:MAG TPA: glycosyltransferase [Eoetvoesiella sp.]